MGLGELADLVQEDRPLAGELEAPGSPRDRAREGAALVAKELALDHGGGECSTIDVDKDGVSAGRKPMDRARNQSLAGTRLPADEHGRSTFRRRRDFPAESSHRGTLADQLAALRRERRLG